MHHRALILAIAAAIAIAAGAATSLFELIVVGVLAALVAVVLGLRREPQGRPGR
jgi:hypothetical protein